MVPGRTKWAPSTSTTTLEATKVAPQYNYFMYPSPAFSVVGPLRDTANIPSDRVPPASRTTSAVMQDRAVNGQDHHARGTSYRTSKQSVPISGSHQSTFL